MDAGGIDRNHLPELYQAEWCPASRRVRQRLTELGLDYVCRQVPVERAERTALMRVTGQETVPAFVSADREVLVGEAPILTYLDQLYDEPAGAEAHRARARKARHRELEEALR